MDVVDFREFYATRLGNTTRRLLANRLKPKCGNLAGATVLGLGFAVPYLEEIAAEASLNLCFMQARQGVIHWPNHGPVQSALVDETDLPLLESVVDVALVIHSLEHSPAPGEMLREIWRVLAPQGRLLLVVPNRRGFWARFDSSPFGHGQPFSRPQIAALLRDCEFSVTSWSNALFYPPSGNGVVLSSASAIEAAASRVVPALSGLLIVEAVKQVYAIAPGNRVRRLSPRFRPALLPAPSRRTGLHPR